MNVEDKVWNTLKGQNPYYVWCRHNFWGGKFYEVGSRSIFVLATSPEEASQFIINNLGVAETYFRSLRIQRGSKKIRAVRRSEGYKLQPSDVGRVVPVTGTMSIKALNQEGEWVRYNA